MVVDNSQKAVITQMTQGVKEAYGIKVTCNSVKSQSYYVHIEISKQQNVDQNK